MSIRWLSVLKIKKKKKNVDNYPLTGPEYVITVSSLLPN